jgi:hypothetical protein
LSAGEQQIPRRSGCARRVCLIYLFATRLQRPYDGAMGSEETKEIRSMTVAAKVNQAEMNEP